MASKGSDFAITIMGAILFLLWWSGGDDGGGVPSKIAEEPRSKVVPTAESSQPAVSQADQSRKTLCYEATALLGKLEELMASADEVPQDLIERINSTTKIISDNQCTVVATPEVPRDKKVTATSSAPPVRSVASSQPSTAQTALSQAYDLCGLLKRLDAISCNVDVRFMASNRIEVSYAVPMRRGREVCRLVTEIGNKQFPSLAQDGWELQVSNPQSVTPIATCRFY